MIVGTGGHRMLLSQEDRGPAACWPLLYNGIALHMQLKVQLLLTPQRHSEGAFLNKALLVSIPLSSPNGLHRVSSRYFGLRDHQTCLPSTRTRRQIQRHPQPVRTVADLTAQVQQVWNSIPQNDIRHLYDICLCDCMFVFNITATTVVINVPLQCITLPASPYL
ncbi:hypothetical protein AVEN_225899-1 [Araneus ventricosus]|uniref:Uncharacterized protein n=1 Tax=Araneus ventricosus TaxID=182803 RepID=A0A4Y2BE35_ARAVE|nr:hypothetical protein AVEN_225899-1 [Araneus ventricosus]